jgi:hypothetical protein
MGVFRLEIAHAKWLDIDQSAIWCTIGGGSLAGACAVFGHDRSILVVLMVFGGSKPGI